MSDIYKPNEYIGDREGQPLLNPVPAGFPSPAEGWVEDSLDIHRMLVKSPASTYFIKVMGESMIGAGIYDGDLLVVDRSKLAQNGKVVIASIEGEMTIKRLVRKNGRVLLMPANPKFKPIDITGNEEAFIWGVVTYCVHNL